MSFLYFAYGSNLWPPRLRARCPSAWSRGEAVLTGWSPIYDKPGADGTAKLNLRESPGFETLGVIYTIDDADRPALDRAEPGYLAFEVPVVPVGGHPVTALTYRWIPEGTTAAPAGWYVAMVVAGAAHHGLPDDYVSRLLSWPPSGGAPGTGPDG